MLYIARAAVEMRDDYSSDYNKGKWYYIKTVDSIEYRWRLFDDLTYEVIGGLFSDRFEALKCAKRMYVTLLYSTLWNGFSILESGCQTYEPNIYVEELDGDEDLFFKQEEYFFWTKTKRGRNLGPSVFEVENGFEELSEYRSIPLSVTIKWPGSDLSLDNVDEYLFSYSRETQKLLNSIVLGDQADNYGMRMTIYCGLLEHLSPEEKKDLTVQEEIDCLIKHVSSSNLNKEQKDQLKNYLNRGKDVSARQKCKSLCDKYAEKQYCEYSPKQIISAAYTIRSRYAHGDEYVVEEGNPARLIKYVVLDVIKNYLREKENGSHA